MHFGAKYFDNLIMSTNLLRSLLISRGSYPLHFVILLLLANFPTHIYIQNLTLTWKTFNI